MYVLYVYKPTINTAYVHACKILHFLSQTFIRSRKLTFKCEDNLAIKGPTTNTGRAIRVYLALTIILLQKRRVTRTHPLDRGSRYE